VLPARQAVARRLRDIKPGAIVLLHNGPDETIDILPDLLAALKKRGYSFGTLSEGTERKPPRR
jgi:peptidoglycan/xylan/chitin deacetylase (PgdA/CDA1 family)